MSARENFESLMAADLTRLAGRLDINTPGGKARRSQQATGQTQALSPVAQSQRADAPAHERNLKKTNDRHSSWILEECKDVRMCLSSVNSTQAVTSLISYKPQKPDSESSTCAASPKLERFWSSVQAQLKQTLPLVSYETWIAPCKLVSAQPGHAIIAVASEFNRLQITKRWLETLTHCISTLAKKPVQVKVVVAPELFPEAERAQLSQLTERQAVQTSSTDNLKRQFPMGAYQNPTRCPKVASLLERYGDMRQVILKSQLFRDAITPETKGGWGIGVGAMIQAGKVFGLARLLYALEHTKAKRGANSLGGTFFYYLRHDFDPKRC